MEVPVLKELLHLLI